MNQRTDDKHGARDWPEDFSQENGNYSCRCSTCREVFIGYKRRLTCKLCALSSSRRIGHSALRVKDGGIEVFDPHPPTDVTDAAVIWENKVNAMPVLPPNAYEGFLAGAAWALSTPSATLKPSEVIVRLAQKRCPPQQGDANGKRRFGEQPMKKPTIIKDFPGQAVEEYRKAHHGHLPGERSETDLRIEYIRLMQAHKRDFESLLEMHVRVLSDALSGPNCGSSK